MKQILLFILALFAFAACSDDDTQVELPDAKLTAIQLNHTDVNFEIGQTQQLTATLTPADFAEDVVWSSDNDKVATISQSGLVTAVGAGQATVTATCAELKATCKFTIVLPFDLISFEAEEKMVDFMGEAATPRDVTLVGGISAGTYNNILMGLDYADQAGPMGLTYDGLLFSSADQRVFFGSYYCDCVEFGQRMDTWCGLVLSKNVNTTATKMDYKDQFSAWASSGANQTATFAVGYDGAMFGGDYSAPIIELIEPRAPNYLYLANSTMVATYLSNKADYIFSVSIEGSLEGQITDAITVPLVKNGVITKEWVKVDLQKLGVVDRLKLTVVSNDPIAPTYFCIDEITLIK